MEVVCKYYIFYKTPELTDVGTYAGSRDQFPMDMEELPLSQDYETVYWCLSPLQIPEINQLI